MPLRFLDVTDAVRLKPNKRVVVRWYNPRVGGFHCAAGKIIKANNKDRLQIRIWIPSTAEVPKSKLLRCKRVERQLYNAKMAYDIALPNEHELESIRKLEHKWLAKKLGWRFEAGEKAKRRADWRYWAARKLAGLPL